MIQVSSAVREMIEAGTLPDFQAEITYADGTGEVLDASHFLSGSPVIKKSISDDGVFTIGGAVIGSFNFSLINDDGHFDETDFTGAKIVPQAGYDETWYPLGTFYLASHKSTGCMIVCTAYDALALLDDVMYTVWPSTFLAAAQTICASHGLTLATTSFTGASMTFEDPTEAMTERMTLAYMAQCTGNHIRIDAAGQMVIERVTGDSKTVEAVFDANLQTSELVYTGIRITPYGGDNASLFGTDGNVLTVSDNPLLTSANLSQVGQMLQSFLSTVNGFTAGTATIPADFTIEPGDTLTINDRRTVSFLVTNLTYKLGVQESVSCDAEDPVTNDLRPRATEMIKVTAVNAEKMVHEALSDISELQDFESNTTSWMEETEQGLVTIRQNHTALSGVVDKTVKESVQLWFTKANTSVPNKPSAEVTSTLTAGNAWRKVVPAFNASYPNYFYCWQYKYADGTFGWSDVVRDIAMGETQGVARDAKNTADNALPAATFTSFESTTFAEIVDEVDEQSTTLKNMTTALSMNADGTSAATDVIHRTSALEQSLESITTRVGKTETSLAGFYATCPTAAGTKAKVATITPTVTGWTLYTGATITVKFTNANTNTAPTLNVNGTGATAIKTYSGEALSADEYKWPAGATFAFTYNGTNWLMQDSTMAVRVASAETSITQNSEAIALRATKTEAQGYATTAEGNAKSDTTEKLKSYSTTTQMNSAIEQKANSIAVSVTETRISELEVGSANLLVDTNAPSLAKVAGEGNRYWSNEASLPEDGTAEFFEVTDPPVNGVTYGIRLTATVARDAERLHGIAFYRQGIARLKFVEGQPYTMSCYARLSPESTNTNRFSLGLEVGNTWTDKSHVYFTPTTEWKKYSRTFVPNTTPPEGKVVYFQMAYLNIGGIDMCGFKMEKGTFATDWTPAIIDTENYADRAVSTAKAEIKVTTDAISTEVSKKVGSSEIISKINQSAEAIQIQASKVEIDGTTTFNAIKTLADAAYDANGAAGVVQENLDNMGLSGKNLLTGTNTVTALTSTGTNANRTWRKAGDGTGTITHIDVTDAPYSILTNGWQFDITSVNGAAYANSLAIAQNAVNVVAGKTYTMSCYAKGTGKLYMFVGISTFIPSDESGKIASLTNDWKRYSITFTAPPNTAVVNANGTNAFFGANGTNVSLSICGMMLEEGDTATLWSPAPGDFAFEEQRIYYRSSVSTKPNGNGLPTTWVTKNTNKWNSVATNADGWSKKVTPISDGKASGVTKYLYLFTCTQSRSISGEVTYSEILLDDSTTVIDGGNIITGTVTANQIAANAITADKIQGQSLSIGLFDDTTKNSILNDNLGTGLGIKWNASTFDGAWNPGEAYFCKYDSSTGLYTDENGWVMFNGIKRTVAKGMQINPNKVIPFNTRTYKVLRLSSTSATTGTQYYVWYNGGWKSSTPATPTVANIADWTWNVNTDIVLCSYVETANEAALVEYEQYTPVRTAHQVTIGNTAYQQAESAAKTASNYIVADSTGLMVAELNGSGETPSTATTNNVLIDSDSVDIRNGQTTLASFSANKIELGKGNRNASIELCEGHGSINYIPHIYDDSGDVQIASDDRLILNGTNDVLLEGWGGSIGVSAEPPIMYPERQEGHLFIRFEDIEIYNKDETIFNTYTTADVTNAIPVTLYNKENAAANESVTLSETAANFKRLTIFFKDTDNNYSSVDVWSPNGKRVSLSLTWINGASTQEMYQRVRWVTISGTTISTYRASASEKYRTGQVKLGATASVTNSDYIAIVHVVGYR